MILSQTKAENPFMPLPSWLRVVLQIYVLVFLFIDPIFSEIIYGPVAPFAFVRLTLAILQAFLLYLPLILYNKNEYGFFHPLIFPLLVLLLKTVGGDPVGSFLMFDNAYITEIENEALIGWSQSRLAYAAIWGECLQILALLFFYLGYFYGPRFRLPKLRVSEIANKSIGFWLQLIAFSSIAVFIGYLFSYGSLTQLLLSWSGRSQNLLEVRALFPFIRIGFLAMLLWFAADKNVVHKLWYWLCLVSTLGAIFLATGSRSTVIYSLIFFGAIWIIHFRKLPSFFIVGGIGFAIVFIGVVGLMRASTWTGEVDTSVITDFSIQRAIESSREEMDVRGGSKGGYLPVVAKVPEEVGLLYGKSYVASVLFFVPRAVWPDKPRGAGIYNKQFIFGGTGGGIPPGDVGEVYWNFHVIGIIVIFFLFGSFLHWLGTFYCAYPYPVLFVPYVITIFTVTPEGTSLTLWLQQIIPMLAIIFWLDLVKRR